MFNLLLFRFAATVWPNGHYVHTLSGRREQPEAYHYWLLYKIPKDPNPESPPPTTYVTPAGKICLVSLTFHPATTLPNNVSISNIILVNMLNYSNLLGVDNLIVNDDDIYLYWYKKI